MASKISVLLIAAVICFTWVEANPTVKYDENGCGPNEYHNDNYQTCEPSCNDRNPMFCPRIGGVNCYCIEGYIRNKYQDCIKIEECPNRQRGDIIFPDD